MSTRDMYERQPKHHAAPALDEFGEGGLVTVMQNRSASSAAAAWVEEVPQTLFVPAETAGTALQKSAQPRPVLVEAAGTAAM